MLGNYQDLQPFTTTLATAKLSLFGFAKSRMFLHFVFYEGGYAVKMISLLNNPSVPGAEYLEVGWK